MSELFELNSFRLVSLMDLLRFYAQSYILIGQGLANYSSTLHFCEIYRVSLSDADAENFKNLLVSIKIECDALCLQVSSALLENAINDPPEGRRELDILSNAIKQEIKSRIFLLIPQHKVKYYEWELKEDLIESFPNASKELKRAGKCYAKGEYTACVFHSMRAAEIALRALAKHLNVTFTFPIELAGWKNIIDKIESEIKAKQQLPKGAAKDEELKYCSEAATHFRYFKDAYRIFVAHARAIYDEEEALCIMEHTDEFLKGLSSKIMEPKP